MFIGKVQTVDETVLLDREAPPSTADLEELSFGVVDIDAFGFLSSALKVPFWAANGGGVPFLLSVDVTDVVLQRPGTGDVDLYEALDLLVDVAPGGPFIDPRRLVLEPDELPVPLEAGLRFLRSPQELGIRTGDTISFTALLRAESPVPPLPVPAPTATAVPTATPIFPSKTRLTVALNTFDSEEIAPHLSGNFSGMSLVANYADHLVGLTVDKPLTNVWGLTKSWEQIDGRTYEFTIKQGIKFTTATTSPWKTPRARWSCSPLRPP